MTFCPLAVSLAEAAVHGGVAAEVVHLLSGGAAEIGESLADPAQFGLERKETSWADSDPVPASSGPTTTEAEDDGESSKLLRMVRERRTTRQRKTRLANS
jgi:hypothetical protein